MPLIEVDWDKFEFRSHYFGQLMTKPKGKTNMQKYLEAQAAYDKKFEAANARAKGPTSSDLDVLNKLKKKRDDTKENKDKIVLSDTCKRRLAQIYTEETTGRVLEIESIYIEKGLQTEEDSITLYSLMSGLFYRKNRETVRNGWVRGEIDFDDNDADVVIDTKSSFDIFTFDLTAAKKFNPDYEWQGHCYMWLKNRKNFRLAYCLNNTPDELIFRMEKRMKNNFLGSEDEFKEAAILLKAKHTYDDLPLERRIRVYDMKRDDEKIELAKSYIPHFREYLKNFKTAGYVDYINQTSEPSFDSEGTDDNEES